jgi:lysophospholipase L1-like esterase
MKRTKNVCLSILCDRPRSVNDFLHEYAEISTFSANSIPLVQLPYYSGVMTKLYCLGDSNTWGYDSRSFFGSRYSESVRWTGILKQSGYEVINLGENGACIPGPRDYAAIARLLDGAAKEDILFIMLGSNDLLSGKSAESAAASLSALLDGLTLFPGKIILAAPPLMKEGEWVYSASIIQESKRLSDLCQDMAEKRHLVFADTHSWNIDLLYDGVHFSPKGHETFAEEMQKLL